MNKNMALISSCLLLFSTQLLADRPAVSEQNTGPAMQESTAQEPTTADVWSEAPSDEASISESATKYESPSSDALDTEDKAPVTESTFAPETHAESTEQRQRQQTGDVLELQSGETLPVHVLDFPHRGMSMDSVQKELGEPLEISPAIGDPPITSWSYNDRTIYFEHSRVIHAVSSH